LPPLPPGLRIVSRPEGGSTARPTPTSPASLQHIPKPGADGVEYHKGKSASSPAAPAANVERALVHHTHCVASDVHQDKPGPAHLGSQLQLSGYPSVPVSRYWMPPTRKQSKEMQQTNYVSPKPRSSRHDALTIDSSAQSVYTFDSAAGSTTSGSMTSFLDSPLTSDGAFDERHTRGPPDQPGPVPRSAHRVLDQEVAIEVKPSSLSFSATRHSGELIPDDVLVQRVENVVVKKPETPKRVDCVIEKTSTYHQLQGFCKGAEIFRNDGHWESIKQTAGFLAVRPQYTLTKGLGS